MGYIRHHTIIVTTFEDEKIEKAHEKASEVFNQPVSDIIKSSKNGYKSFFIPPDGSKEGWDRSKLGDMERDKFINWLDNQRWGDGSTSLNWVEVQFGDQEGWNKILRDSDEFWREREFKRERDG